MVTIMWRIIAGGTIGLFTGLSLISVIEVVYWIYRALVACLGNAWPVGGKAN